MEPLRWENGRGLAGVEAHRRDRNDEQCKKGNALKPPRHMNCWWGNRDAFKVDLVRFLWVHWCVFFVSSWRFWLFVVDADRLRDADRGLPLGSCIQQFVISTCNGLVRLHGIIWFCFWNLSFPAPTRLDHYYELNINWYQRQMSCQTSYK
jgi:hypothetical protein